MDGLTPERSKRLTNSFPSDVKEWWLANAKQFPNVERMARQYLGCPASSAAVERLFSAVGIAFSDKCKSTSAATLMDRMFARANL